MSDSVALVFEGFAVTLVGIAPMSSRSRAGSAVLLALAALMLGVVAGPASMASALHSSLHIATLGLCAALLLLCCPDAASGSSAPDAARWDSVLVASLLVASSSRGWLVFVCAFALSCALWIRTVGFVVPVFSFASLLGASALSYLALGSFGFSASAPAGGGSAQLLTGSLALATSAAVLVASAAFGCARASAEGRSESLRTLVSLAWGAVMIASGPLAGAFSGAPWRDATGGWQGVLGVSGVIGLGVASFTALRALREGWGTTRVVGALLPMQLALTWTSWAGIGSAARAAAELGALSCLVSYLLFRAPGGAVWARGIAFALVGGVPASAVFWARSFGLGSLARAESFVLLVVVTLGSVVCLALVVRSLMSRESSFGGEKRGTASSRVVAVALVLLSLLPGWLASRVVGDF